MATTVGQKVLVYRNTLLPLSETFIKEQVLSYHGWHGVLVGMRRLRDGLSLDKLDCLCLKSEHPNLMERGIWKLWRRFERAPPHIGVLLRQKRASLLHAHFGMDALEAWPLARSLNIPMVVTLHGYDININRSWWEAGHGGPGMLNYPMRLLILSKQRRVTFIAVSNAIRRRAISFGIPPDKIFVQYIGVNCNKFSPGGRPVGERERRVLFIGRLIEKKGCEYLIKAFVRVQEAVPDSCLVIVGDGELRASLQQLAKGLAIRATFRGAIASEDVRHEMHLAKVFCLPSILATNGDAEGLPIVLLEAQACGIPVVTSAIGGIDEAICDGITGYAIRERDVTTLAQRLIKLLKDDATASSMATAARKLVLDRFDITKCTAELESLYDACRNEGDLLGEQVVS
jgi:glycosyltransferase involved in cell wall biosynthesis